MSLAFVAMGLSIGQPFVGFGHIQNGSKSTCDRFRQKAAPIPLERGGLRGRGANYDGRRLSAPLPQPPP